jgi:hypothetical protein
MAGFEAGAEGAALDGDVGVEDVELSGDVAGVCDEARETGSLLLSDWQPPNRQAAREIDIDQRYIGTSSETPSTPTVLLNCLFGRHIPRPHHLAICHDVPPCSRSLVRR